MTNRNCAIGMILALSTVMVLESGCKKEPVAPMNHDPTITSIVAFPDKVHSLDSFAVVCSAYDVDGENQVYDWFCNPPTSVKGGHGSENWILYNSKENIAIFYAPDSANTVQDSIRIDVDVRDGIGGSKSGHIFVGLSR
jgi:hypothetical protein